MSGLKARISTFFESRAAKVTVAIFLVILAIRWITFADLVRVTRDNEAKDAALFNRATAQFLASDAGRALDHVARNLERASVALASDDSPYKLRALVSLRVLSTFAVRRYAFTDADGVWRGTDEGAAAPESSFVDPVVVQALLLGKDEGERLVLSPANGGADAQAVWMLRPFVDALGGTRGVVAAEIDFEAAVGVAGSTEGGLHVIGELVDLDGAARLAPSGIDRQTLGFVGTEAAGRVKDVRSGDFAARGPAGQDRLASYEKLGDWPLIAVASTARGDSDALADPVIRREFAISVGSSILMVLATALILNVIRRLRNEERASDEAGRRSREAMEAIPDGVTLHDPEGKLIFANSAVARMYPELARAYAAHESQDALIDSAITAGYYSADDPQVAHWKALRDKAVDGAIGPVELLRRDGRWIRYSQKRTTFGDIVALRTDITDIKEREAEQARDREALAHQAKTLETQAVELRSLAKSAEQANVAKSAFLAAISHEIRTPLNAIYGFAHVLSRAPLPPEEAQQMKAIETNARLLKILVADILDYSTMEAGHLSLDRAPFSPRELVCELTSVAVELIDDKPIRFESTVEDAVADRYLGDKARLAQIGLNFISNAVKFSGQGTIRFAVARSADGWGLRFSCSDEGCGVPAQERTRIFETFEQGAARGAARRAGVGLGLAICRRLVQSMEGEIGLTSEIGRGSTFWFEVPLPVAGRPAAPAARADAAPATPLRILVAEDSPASLLLLELLLRRRGHRVLSAMDGAAAVRLAEAERFDLAILDLQMPVMGGLEAARRMRRLPPTLGADRIIALTAEAFAAERAAALAAGIDDVLTKPFDESDLDEHLRRAADRAAVADPVG